MLLANGLTYEDKHKYWKERYCTSCACVRTFCNCVSVHTADIPKIIQHTRSWACVWGDVRTFPFWARRYGVLLCRRLGRLTFYSYAYFANYSLVFRADLKPLSLCDTWEYRVVLPTVHFALLESMWWQFLIIAKEPTKAVTVVILVHKANTVFDGVVWSVKTIYALHVHRYKLFSSRCVTRRLIYFNSAGEVIGNQPWACTWNFYSVVKTYLPIHLSFAVLVVVKV